MTLEDRRHRANEHDMRGVASEVLENHYHSYATYMAKINTWVKIGKYMHKELDGPTSYIGAHFIIEGSSSSMHISNLSSYFMLHYDKGKKTELTCVLQNMPLEMRQV